MTERLPRELLKVAAVAESDGLRREGDREVPLGNKARRTRASLLQAAYEQFSETGYRGTTVAMIAARAGVSLGTFYQYFRDRSGVMTTLVAEAVRRSLEQRREQWTMASGREGVRRLLGDYVEGYAASAAFQGVWEEATHVEEQLASVRRELSRFLTETVEREFRRTPNPDHPDLDPAILARALTAMVDRYCYLTFVFDPPDPQPSTDQSVEALTDIWSAVLGLDA